MKWFLSTFLLFLFMSQVHAAVVRYDVPARGYYHGHGHHGVHCAWVRGVRVCR